MLPTQIDLRIVSPGRQVVHDSVAAVSIPGQAGYLGILPGHAPLLTELKAGEVAYAHAGTTQRLAISWGFAEVLPDRVIILAETADWPEEIDVERAERARQRAEERLKNSSATDVDMKRAQAALERRESATIRHQQAWRSLPAHSFDPRRAFGRLPRQPQDRSAQPVDRGQAAPLRYFESLRGCCEQERSNRVVAHCARRALPARRIAEKDSCRDAGAAEDGANG